MSFTKSKTEAAVRYNPGMKPAQKRKSGKKAVANEQIRDFEIVQAKSGIDKKLDHLRAQPDVSVGTHVWYLNDEQDSAFVPTGYLYIEFKPGTAEVKQRDLLDEFAQVLADSDALVVAEVYAAGEAPIPGADGKALCRAIRTRGRVEPVLLKSLDELPDVLAGIVREDDVVLTMGAGHIGAVSNELPRTLPAAVATRGQRS